MTPGGIASGWGVEYRAGEVLIPGVFPAEIKMAFAICAALAERVRGSFATGRFPVVLSGNCNVAVGTVAGCGCGGTDVVWFDAHGEATTAGFVEGWGFRF